MLLKNVLRSIKKKPLRIVGIILLVIMASTLYVGLSYSITGLERGLDHYVEEQNQEDFTFEMNPYLTEREIELYNIDLTDVHVLELNYLDNKGIINKEQVFEDRVNKLKSQYDVDIEKRLYKQFESHSDLLDKKITVRIFKNTERINKTYIEEGTLPTKLGEIALSKVFAEQNNLTIGDQIDIKNQKFKIVGFVIFPDYIYPQLSEQSLVFNPSNQVLATLSESEYTNLDVVETSHFTGIANDKDLEIEDINKPYIVNLMDSKTAFKTGAIYGEIEGNKQMTKAMAGVILILAVIVIGIIVNKSINSEKKQIGVIKSLGYTDLEIMKAYMIYPILAGVLGVTLGYIIGFTLSEPLSAAYQLFYQLPDVELSHNIGILVGGVIIPFFALNLFSFLIIYLIVRNDPLDLIKPKTKHKTNCLVRLITRLLKRAKFETRFKYSLALRGTGKLVVSFMGVLIASIYLVFAVMGIKAFDDIIDDTFGDATYNYQATYKYPVNKEFDSDQDVYTMLPSTINRVNKNEVSENISLFGVSEQINLMSIKNEEEENLLKPLFSNENNVIITKMLAVIVEIELGDTIIIETVTGNIEEVKVVGITNNYSYPYVYMQKKVVNNYLGLDNSYYNGKYSKDEIDLNDDDLLTVFNKTELIKSLEELMSVAKSSIYAIVLVAIVIGLIVLILIANFTIEDHFKTISFLKVMGYNKKEVSNMVINIYLPIVIIAYLLAIPVTHLGFNALMSDIAKEMNFVIPLSISFYQAVIGLLVIIMTYYLSLMIAKRKLKKIALQESLKIDE